MRLNRLALSLTKLRFPTHISHRMSNESVLKFSSRAGASPLSEQSRDAKEVASLSPQVVAIEEAHQIAMSLDEPTYIDPVSGYQVFTEGTLLLRGKCCGNRCRHCPYAHFNVARSFRNSAQVPKKPVLIQQRRRNRNIHSDTVVDVLFYSGGKSSYLSLLALQADPKVKKIVIFSIFDAKGELPFQSVRTEDIMDHAKSLKLDLLLCPQTGPSNDEYVQSVLSGLAVVKEKYYSSPSRKRGEGEETSEAQVVETDTAGYDPRLRLSFGDVHGTICREWREETFAAYYPLHFPLWGCTTDGLLQTLEDQKTGGKLMAVNIVNGEGEGKEYNYEFVAGLPEEMSSLGENGEFNSLVQLS